MKISMDQLTGYYSNIQNTRQSVAKESSVSSTGRNFDEIVIRSSTRQGEESQFADRISNNLLQNLNAQTAEDKVLKLKEQVRQGQYQIDAGLVASKILLQ